MAMAAVTAVKDGGIVKGWVVKPIGTLAARDPPFGVGDGTQGSWVICGNVRVSVLR